MLFRSLHYIARDKSFGLEEDDLDELLDAGLYIGRAPGQVTDFLKEYIWPLLEANKAALANTESAELHV